MAPPTWAQQFLTHTQACVDVRVREGLWARGVSEEQIATYGLGYTDGKLPDLPFPKVFREWCWNGRRLDGFYVLPLSTALGELGGFQFRAMDRDRKLYSDYMLTQEEPVTFGFGQALESMWKTGSVWVVEGVFDMLPLQRALPNVIPTLTAKIPYPLIRMLRRVVKHIWLMYDADKTGKESAEWFVKHHGTEFELHPVQVPKVGMAGGKSTHDPGELWEAWGDEKLAKWLAEQQDGPWSW